MRIPRVFEPVELQENSQLTLSENSFTHVVKVLRLREGDALVLFNGDGREFSAQLTEVGKKEASVTLGEAREPNCESPLKIEIGQSISRGDRMDYAVQKATELGVSCVTPLFTERCEVRLNEDRQGKRQRRWQQVAISACEQSQRTRIPELAEPITLESWLKQCDADLKLVLHHHTAQPMGSFERPESVALLIGPEGGLTEAEVEMAQAAGFKPVAFGPRVMRTETAPVAACAILHYLWGDFS